MLLLRDRYQPIFVFLEQISHLTAVSSIVEHDWDDDIDTGADDAACQLQQYTHVGHHQRHAKEEVDAEHAHHYEDHVVLPVGSSEYAHATLLLLVVHVDRV